MIFQKYHTKKINAFLKHGKGCMILKIAITFWNWITFYSFEVEPFSLSSKVSSSFGGSSSKNESTWE